jgi:hypothetical protein
MSIGSINPLSNDVQSLLTSAVQSAGLTTNTTNNSPSGIDQLSSVSQPDNGRLSPFAQMMSELQQLQQSDPAKYQQVTQQIATNLQSASQDAQAQGNTTAATQLSQLATDFTNASKSGNLPNIQDLAKAVGGHHGHHHHMHTTPVDSDGTSSTSSSTSSNSAIQTLSQLLSAFQSGGAQGNATDPMSIIMSTLSSVSSAGISGTNG